jgi:hypothetical protein
MAVPHVLILCIRWWMLIPGVRIECHCCLHLLSTAWGRSRLGRSRLGPSRLGPSRLGPFPLRSVPARIGQALAACWRCTHARDAQSARSAAECAVGYSYRQAAAMHAPGGSPRPCAAPHLDSRCGLAGDRRVSRFELGLANTLFERPPQRATRHAGCSTQPSCHGALQDAACHVARRMQHARWHALSARFSVFLRVSRKC